jgi:hypothetical protein
MVMRLRPRSGKTSSKTTGYVGDHADKLNHIPALRLDDADEERPSREDLSADSTIFTRSPVPLPRFLRGSKQRRPRD